MIKIDYETGESEWQLGLSDYYFFQIRPIVWTKIDDEGNLYLTGLHRTSGNMCTMKIDGTIISTNDVETGNSQITVKPNPFSYQTIIEVPNESLKISDISMVNDLGQQVNVSYKIIGNNIVITRGNLPSGLYFFMVYYNDQTIDTAKLIVK